MSDPLHIISLGAGVQSSTMALMAEAGEITPKPIAAIFSDTEAEPAKVYEWLNWLETRLSFPVIRVTNGSLAVDALTVRQRKDGNGSWVPSGVPHYSINVDGSHGHGPRQCTEDFKLNPIIRQQRAMVEDRLKPWKKQHKEALSELAVYERLLRIWRREKKKKTGDEGNRPMRPLHAWSECQSDPLVIAMIGISLDEASRMKPALRPWIVNRYPLVDAGIKRRDCLQWMTARGFPTPPRSACVFCPYHSDAEWQRLKTEEPEDFARAVQFEKDYQDAKAKTVSKKGFVPFLHSKRVPLDSIEFDPHVGQTELFQNDCLGMCGV